jgi:hypothetical protein
MRTGYMLPVFSSIAVLTSCTPVAEDVRVDRSRSRDLIVERDASGQKIIYQTRAGVVDRTNPIRTDPGGWSPNNFQVITCVTFKATEHITGAEICGVSCSDGTHYRLECKADIFSSGFDKQWSE